MSSSFFDTLAGLQQASFVDHEDVPLEAVYRDPVHDFGIFKFDPAKIRHMKLEELQLRPDCARVGTEIRVLGNNAGGLPSDCALHFFFKYTCAQSTVAHR